MALFLPDAAWIKPQAQPARTIFERVKSIRDAVLFKVFDSLTVERKSTMKGEEIGTPHLPDLHMEGETYVGVASGARVRIAEDRRHNLTLLSSASPTGFMAVVFADGLKEWQTLAGQVFPARLEQDWQAQLERYRSIAKELPCFETGYHSHIPHFVRMQPLYMQSMKVEDTGAFQADNWGYWVWGWDTTLPCFGLLNAGRFGTSREHSSS